MTLEEVIAKFPAEVRARYDFSNARYEHALAPITGIVCPEHGEFRQYSAQLRKGGAGCPTCGDAVRRAKRRTPQDEMLTRFAAVHGDAYEYTGTVYKNRATKVSVTCREHGDFQILPGNHLNGQGCPACGALKRGRRKTLPEAARKTADTKLAAHAERFAEDARKVHGDRYDYREAVYAGRRVPVRIVCPDHGPFEQTPGHHLTRGHGCPQCSHHRSRGEAGIAAFLSIFTFVAERDRTVISPKELDIYLPGENVAVEYCGEYWHAVGTPDEERTTKNRHRDKQRACDAQGVRLITVYESEWLTRPAQIKRLLRNVIGKSRGKVAARKCEVELVGAQEAAAFFDSYHPQGGSGWGVHYGLRYRGKLVACMRFTFGANDRGAHAERVWTLSRYATRVPVIGGASKLFAAFCAEYDPACVKSFSDNRYFTGDMYAKLGFALDEESDPDYQVYHPKLGLMPKTSWQRRKIPARIRDLGVADAFDPKTDPRSERDMTFALGAMRLYDCGKKRWLWTPPKNT